jgi:serine/threonine-protein kinase
MLGQVIHGYRIDQALSVDKGGFGDVYFATHVDSGAEAVVKVLKPEMSMQRDIVARFLNEARAAASVHHPGVVQIHNVGYHGDRAYLLMERLRGDDLESRLAAGPLLVERALVFMRQAAGAVGAAHERGIIHRDLKPANLFVVGDPDVVGGERVKVLDFGIAKLTADAGAGKTQGVFGTPAYMSPEQCASTGAVDARSDLYSLGCIFYELVCGRPPFGQGGTELIAAHLRDAPAPPRTLAPWVPPAVEQVILGLLEKQPDRRLPSCVALIAALDEAAAASGLSAASAPYLQAAPNLVQRPAEGRGGAHPTTLRSAAGAAPVTPPARRRGVWLAVGAVAAVAISVVVALAMPARSPAGGGPGSSSGITTVGHSDAGVTATASVDAARVATVTVDAATIAPASDAAIAANDSAAVAPRAPALVDAAAKLYEQGQERRRARDYEAARQLFSQAIAQDPRVTYFLDLAVVDIELGHDDAAAAALRESLLHAPTPDEAAGVTKLFEILSEKAKRTGRKPKRPEPPSRVEAPAAPADPTATAEPPAALSQVGIAARLNEEGKALMDADRYGDAARKFQEAIAHVPNAQYFINLCTAWLQAGKFDAALTACHAVALNNSTADQQARANSLIGRIHEEARKQNIKLSGQ